MGATFDEASINPRLVKIHQTNKKLVHKVKNPYATDNRDFFFFLILLISSKQPETAGLYNAVNFG